MDFRQISENNKLLLVYTVNGPQERKRQQNIKHIDISHLSAPGQIHNSFRPSPSLILICTVDGGPKSGNDKWGRYQLE